jgi:glycosyltransferase involved in cell wall biosynthesis
MVPLYAVLAAPLVRPLGIPLVLWYTHWKGHAVVRAAEMVCTAIASVDERSFPLASRKVHAIGHGIDLDEFTCTDVPGGEQLRALVLGRYSPAKGLETILRGAELAGVQLELHGSDESFEQYKRRLERLDGAAELGGPLPESRFPGSSHAPTS